MPKQFAVIGNPIEHSLSPFIHQHFAGQMGIDLVYETLLGEEPFFENQVRDFFNQGGQGLNVTLPFKQKAFSLAEEMSPRCALAGAANTLWMKEDTLYGDNTDGIGLVRDLSRYLHLEGKTILVLGAGGAVRGIINPLLELNIAQLTVANRTPEKAKELQKHFPQIQCNTLTQLVGQYDLIINGTSASLSGQVLAMPPTVMSYKPLCYDLAYAKNKETPFVHYARNLGCDAVDGLGMLVEQAAESFYLWHGVMPETSATLRAIRSIT